MADPPAALPGSVDLAQLAGLVRDLIEPRIVAAVGAALRPELHRLGEQIEQLAATRGRPDGSPFPERN